MVLLSLTFPTHLQSGSAITLFHSQLIRKSAYSYPQSFFPVKWWLLATIACSCFLKFGLRNTFAVRKNSAEAFGGNVLGTMANLSSFIRAVEIVSAWTITQSRQELEAMYGLLVQPLFQELLAFTEARCSCTFGCNWCLQCTWEYKKVPLKNILNNHNISKMDFLEEIG